MTEPVRLCDIIETWLDSHWGNIYWVWHGHTGDAKGRNGDRATVYSGGTWKDTEWLGEINNTTGTVFIFNLLGNPVTLQASNPKLFELLDQALKAHYDKFRPCIRTP